MRRYRVWWPVMFGLCIVAVLSGCGGKKMPRGDGGLIEVARSDQQWTGVAVSKKGRIFVNFPRWSDSVTLSVAEVTAAGKILPFPDEQWNTWSISSPPQDHFVCVQSVYIDSDNFLWILDPANPKFGGVVKGGPKLLKVDLETNAVVQTISFGEAVAPRASYLNDVRVDTRRGYAYITDSGTGALLVVNLRTGKSRRLLAGHPSTKSEIITIVIDGKEWRRPDGSIPQVHVDGIAIDPDGEFLYYHALSGRILYRIGTRWLRDEALSEKEVEEKVEFLARTVVSDGMIFGPGGTLYLSALEEHAIKLFTPDRAVKTIIQDKRLAWPDSFAAGPDGFLYVTTSQIHLGPNPPDPYRIFKFRP